jgi:porin
VALAAFLGPAAAARAEDALHSPLGARSLADTPFQLVLPREHLFGDWFGARSWLEDHGVTPTVTFVMDALGNPSGGKQQGFTQASNLGLDVRLDLDRLFGLTGGSFDVSFSERFGESLSQQDIGNVFTVQQVLGGDTYKLVNVSYEQRLLDDRVQFKVGRIGAGDDFIASSTASFCRRPIPSMTTAARSVNGREAAGQRAAHPALAT